ncbi:MAG: apiosidase-like domain-containing protein, partial [Chitinophagaceae bacterium]
MEKLRKGTLRKTPDLWRNLWILLVLTLAVSPIQVMSFSHAIFPLRWSANKRFLVDQQNHPFLIREISAWGAIQALSEKEEEGFMDSVQKKGFNTLLVSIISYDTRFAGHPPDWEGHSPFLSKWDFSTYNPAYFKHVDHFLKLARQKGVLVLLVPCYLGYKGDPKQGWWAALLSAKNSPEKCLQYGKYLGRRYQKFPNIIWVAGGDNNGRGKLFPYMNNMIRGIREYDPQHLWTGHFDCAPGTTWSVDNPLYRKYMDIDGLYAFTESALGKEGPQYRSEDREYMLGKMIIQLDQSYEEDIPHSSDNENHQWIRRKNYDGLLSGCSGTSFCPGLPGNPCYTFKHWRPLMNTEGMREASYCFDLFLSRPWSVLLPDSSHRFLYPDPGTEGTRDAVCDARTADGHTLIA